MRVAFAVLCLFAWSTWELCSAEVRIGIIGTDTSHVVAFTRVLNDPANPENIPGFRIAVAVKGGSADIESSRTRVEGYADELRTKWHV